MISLFLAIACSSTIALIFKITETGKMNRYTITCFNYLTASAISGLFIALQGIPLNFQGNWFNLLKTVLVAVSDSTILTESHGFVWAVTSGGIAGIFFFCSFIFYQISVKKYGAGISGAFAKLGIFLPMILSVVIWREIPSRFQWIGMGFAGFALLAVNIPSMKSLKSLRFSLLALFFWGGMAEFSNKIFQKYASFDFKPLFLLTTFCSAFVYSVAVLVYRRDIPIFRDIIMGIAVGIPNLFSSFFLIDALARLPAAAVFSLFGAGTIVIINIAGMVFWKEKLNIWELVSIIMTVIGIIFVALSG
ncbi:DMT family transporter [bacterium]|nr:DMT family transporter [candidate division CSSED10-310 bacterium]